MSFDHVAPYLAADGICPDPVFIIGSPRSGTTALSQALKRHPDLWVGEESYFLHDFFRWRRPESVWANHTNRVTRSWLAAEEVAEDEFQAFVGLGFNALYTSRSEGKRWVDQTPLYTAMASTLAKMFPGAKFIHIVRDGRNVVRSMINFERKFDTKVLAKAKTGEIPQWDIDSASETWSESVDAAFDFGEANPDRCLSVWNEQLADDSHLHFEKILDFLELPHDPGPADFFAEVRVGSSFKRDAVRPDDDDWSEWSRRRRKVFTKVGGDTWVRAGYGSAEELREWTNGRG